jgi:hypothetical protein
MRISRWSKVDARWYLGVHCRECETPILFALDHSEGEVQPAPAGKLLLTCGKAECRHRADYSKATVLRFQKPTPALNETGSPYEARKG